MKTRIAIIIKETETKFRCFFLILSLNLLWSYSCHAQPLIWDKDAITELRHNIKDALYTSIIKQASNICERAPTAVTDKKTSRSGDKHNYESLSIYYWPDPENPNGTYIVRDGFYNMEYKQYDLPRLITLSENLQYLSVAFYITNKDKYYKAFCQQIDTWFINEATRMNPNFEYSQFIPGKNNGKGCAAGLIDAYAFNDVIESIRLIETVRPIGKKRDKALKSWFQDFAIWMQESDIGKQDFAAKNNQGTAYDITLFNIAYWIGNKKTCTNIIKDFGNRRLKSQIEEDGKQPLELYRTRGFKYSVFNLQHIIDFCIMQHRLNTNFNDIYGKIVSSALTFLTQFIGNKDLFPYQEVGDWNKEETNLIREIKRYNKISNQYKLPEPKGDTSPYDIRTLLR